MLRAARILIRRLGYVSVVLLTLVFAAPAFESHACADESPLSASQVAEASGGADDVQCPDCGPACANGCCHLTHSAIAPDVATPRAVSVFVRPAAWVHVAGGPLDRPAGPDRPPQI